MLKLNVFKVYFYQTVSLLPPYTSISKSNINIITFIKNKVSLVETNGFIEFSKKKSQSY